MMRQKRDETNRRYVESPNELSALPIQGYHSANRLIDLSLMEACGLLEGRAIDLVRTCKRHCGTIDMITVLQFY